MDFQSLQEAKHEKEKAKLLAELAQARQSLASIRLRIHEMGHNHEYDHHLSRFISALGLGDGFSKQSKSREIINALLLYILTGRKDHERKMRGEEDAE